jgi:hypothetical protein
MTDAILEARKCEGGLKVDAKVARWWVSRGSKGQGWGISNLIDCGAA